MAMVVVDAAVTAAILATNWLFAISGDSLKQSLRHELFVRRLLVLVKAGSDNLSVTQHTTYGMGKVTALVDPGKIDVLSLDHVGRLIHAQ